MTLTGDERIFVIILVINALVALVYLFFGVFVVATASSADKKEDEEFLHDNRRTFLLRFLVMLLCPVTGIVFFLVSHVLYLTLFRFQVDLEDVIFSKERVRTQVKADEDRERNVVSIEEATALGDDKNLRQAMMNALKGEIQDSLASIALALNTTDSEASHYAASVLSHELSIFRMEIQKLYRGMQEEGSEQAEYARMLIEYSNSFLRQKIFANLEQEKYIRMMAEAAELYYSKKPAEFTEQQYEGVCMRLLEMGNYEAVKKWCLRLAKQYPNCLAAYTCRLRLYFTIKDRKAFFQVLDDLKQSDVVIDHETLELIRIFG